MKPYIPSPSRAVVNLENGQRFESLSAAAAFLNVKVSTLQNAIARQSKVSYGTWRYASEERVRDRSRLDRVLAAIEQAKQECLANPQAFPSTKEMCLIAGVGHSYLNKYTPQSFEANEAYWEAFRVVCSAKERRAA